MKVFGLKDSRQAFFVLNNLMVQITAAVIEARADSRASVFQGVLRRRAEKSAAAASVSNFVLAHKGVATLAFVKIAAFGKLRAGFVAFAAKGAFFVYFGERETFLVGFHFDRAEGAYIVA
ncbi:MAG TPA: hypothetical protein PLS05_07550 [Clostridia bacterium]|nr:hypothetical protein [Clostridia bacterium]